MSNNYTLIGDLNNANTPQMGMPQSIPQGMPQSMPQGMPQSMPQGMPQSMPQGMPQGMSQMGMPNDKLDMYQKYLNDSGSDSDSTSDSDSDNESKRSSNDRQHYYGILTLILLAIILYYVFKIRKELMGMYEEV